MIITICGKPGSGKSTVGELIAKELGYDYTSVGDFMGEIAKERGMDLMELLKVAREEDWVDKEVDKKNIEIGKSKDDVVVDARLGWHFIPDSIKVFLDVSSQVAAKRIFKDQRDDEAPQKTVEGMENAIKERMESEKARYKKWYGLDIYDLSNYDILVDTSDMTVEEIVDDVLRSIERLRANQ